MLYIVILKRLSIKSLMQVYYPSSTHTVSVTLLYKNLAIANRSRVSCINTNYTMTLKSGLEVTQDH